MNGKIDRLASALAEAWRMGGAIPLPALTDAPSSRAEALAVQDRMAELIGGRIAGWKVEATVKAVQVFEGHDGPLPGRIFAEHLHMSPAVIPAKKFHGIKIECEFAFRLKQALPDTGAPFTADGIADALVFHPAIEVSGTCAA